MFKTETCSWITCFTSCRWTSITSSILKIVSLSTLHTNLRTWLKTCETVWSFTYFTTTCWWSISSNTFCALSWTCTFSTEYTSTNSLACLIIRRERKSCLALSTCIWSSTWTLITISYITFKASSIRSSIWKWTNTCNTTSIWITSQTWRCTDCTLSTW